MLKSCSSVPLFFHSYIFYIKLIVQQAYTTTGSINSMFELTFVVKWTIFKCFVRATNNVKLHFVVNIKCIWKLNIQWHYNFTTFMHQFMLCECECVVIVDFHVRQTIHVNHSAFQMCCPRLSIFFFYFSVSISTWWFSF